MDKLWTISGNAGLAERGSMLLGEKPIELENAQFLTENALEMRQGFAVESLTGSGLTGVVQWLGRNLTLSGTEELWGAANNSGTAALAMRTGGSWSVVGFSDTATAGNLLYMHGASMNGKFFLTYDSDVNRLHVWDGTTLRRVGLIVATAPTSAEDGAGALSFTRWYRQRNTVQVSGITVRRSEPSTSITRTIVNKAGITVTKGALSGDGETHWELEAASAAAGPWYRIATTVVGTTTYDDTSATISTTDLSAVDGLYIVPPAAKYIVSDGASLLMAGAWESTSSTGQTVPKQNRVWFTRPLGSSDVSDDESIPTDADQQNNWIDIGDTGPITGLAGPINGEITVTKERAKWKLVPTGDLINPYAKVLVTDAIGAVDQRLITSGELGGVPAVFFADSNADYADAGGGVQAISEPIGRDLRSVTIVADPGLQVFDPFQRMLFLQTSSAPSLQAGSYRSFIMDTVKQRWAGFTLGGSSSGWILGTSLLGTDTYLGGSGSTFVNGVFAAATDGSRRMFLCGQDANGAGTIVSWGAQCALDGESTFIAIARYRKVLAPGRRATVGAPTVFYRNPQGSVTGTQTLEVTYVRDFDEQRAQSVTLDATDQNNGIAIKQTTLEGLSSADVSTLDVILALSYTGTAYTSETTPCIDAIMVPYSVKEPYAQ